MLAILTRKSTRFERAVIAAFFAGLSIGLVDSRPGWDDTGISATALLAFAGIAAAIGARRPWVFAVLVGMWVPILEIPAGAGLAPLIALVFAAVGAAVGYLAARAMRQPSA